MLSAQGRRTLISTARERITSHLEGSEPHYPQRVPELEAPAGAFVSLHIVHGLESRLRGCIGRITSDRPLYDTVRETAFSAAFHDPRFPPLEKDELRNLLVEISVLSALVRVGDVRAIEPGLHGILIEHGHSSGLLLPQVAAQHRWNRETFLEQTCRKAGLAPDAWRSPNTVIRAFTAEVFDETSTTV